MMTARRVKAALASLANPAKAAILQRFFKTGPGEYGEGDVFLGLTVPQQRKVARAFAHIGQAHLATLLRSRIHEERLVALLILVHQFERGDAKTQARIFGFYLDHLRRINNWDLVDLSAPKIVGAWLLPRNRQLLGRLAKSRCLWERRIAVLATSVFIRELDFEDTLALARILLADREDLIHKAVGWMLREVGQRNVSVLEGFLEAHAHHMPRTMLRYAIERLPDAKRKRYLRA